LIWLVVVLRSAELFAMNPIVMIVPVILVMSGVICFLILPIPLGIRALILVTDLVAAGIVGLILWRRFR
jgi:hypothetical protein